MRLIVIIILFNHGADFLNALVVVLNTGKITHKTSFGFRKGFMVAEAAEEDFEVRPKVRPEI